MKKRTNYEIIKELLGPINPLGCSSRDNERLENLKETAEIVDKLLTDMDNIVVENKHSQEKSIKDSVELVSKFYDELGIVE